MLSTVQKEIKGGAKRLKKISKNFNKKIKISLKKISSFYKRNKLLSAISLSAFFLLLSGLFLLVSNQTKPNDKIYFLKTNNKAILQNKNPTFNVSFGQREEPGKQWTRFEAKAVKENPFEEEKKGFFEKLLNTIEPKRAFGIEVSLEKIGNKRIETKTELAEIEVPQKKDQEYQLVEKQAVINPDVIEGVDIEYQILEGMGLKENIVIHDLNQYISHCEGDLEGCNLNEFVFDLKLDDGLEVKKGWFTLNMKSGKIYYFTDKNGNYVAHFLPSWANDSLGNKTYDVKLDITEEGGGLKIKVVVNKEWIESEERVYPIRIDPTIVHDTALVFEGGSFVNTKITSKPSIELIESKRPSIDSNTVAYWTLDQQSGSGAYLLDESGNGYHGTPSGTTYISDGVLEGARNFNGSQAITTNLDAAANNLYADTSYAWSVEGWFRHTGATSDGAIVGRGGGTGTSATFGVFVNPNGSLVAVIRGNYTTIKSGVADNKWHHFAVSWDGGVGSYYFDGILGGSLSIGTVALQTGRNVTIGASSNGTNSYYSGDIDEIRISNFSRSKEEIQRTYLNALSRISGNYTSPVVDIGSVSNLEALSWNSEGVHTSDGETPYSSTGLVGQWNFNESSGTTAVSGGSCGTSCNGTLTNFSNTSGRDVVAGSGWSSNNRRWGSGALMFDGSDDYVSISDNNSLDLTDSITLESWVMFNSLSTWQAIISKRDVSLAEANYGLRTSSNQLVFYFYANGAWQDTTTTNANLVAGEWYHISATYDGSSVKIYLNGKLLNSSCISGTCNIPMVADDNNLAIGRAGDNPIQYFSGIIDSTRIYSRTLTPSEILSNYQSGNIEFQYRTSTDGSTWGNWSGGVEESIDNMESATSWQSSNSDVLQIGDTNYSIEGSHSLQIQGGKQKIATGTIGHWSLDETGGTSAYIKDYSGNGNHGTPTGTTYVRDGQIGGSRSFNGSNEYVNLGTGLTPGLPITLSMWVYPRSTNQAQLFSTDKLLFTTHNHTGMWAAINPGGTVSVHYGNNTACASTGRRSKAGTTSLALYQWHHLTLVISGATNMNIYINGVDDGGSYSGTGGNIVYANRDASIGAGGECSTANKIYVFDGIIDDVNLYNYSFTREQAIQLYEAGKHHRVSKTLGTSTDLSSRTKIPFWVASDTLGTNLEFIYNENNQANYEPDANTVGLWHLDEELGSGSYIKDSSSNNNNGTPTGTTYTEGKIGGGRYLNGTSDVITIPNHSALNFERTNPFSISSWVKSSNSATQTIISKMTHSAPYRGYDINIVGDVIRVHINSTWSSSAIQVDGTTKINDGLWHHVVLTYNGNSSGSGVKIYVDGKLENMVINNNNLAATIITTAPLVIGNRNSGTGRFFNGLIDEVHIANIEYTPVQIRQSYEIQRRTHPITVNFKANLVSSNLITGGSDTSFNISEKGYGTTNDIENIDVGEKIVVKENFNGTEYIAQGQIDTVNKSTGAVTVSSWDTGSTFPSGGFTVNATVFKWQREYVDIRYPLDEDIDSVSRLTFRKTTNVPAIFWIDDIKKAKYLDDPTGDTFQRVENKRYLQYKPIFTAWDPKTSSDFYLDSVSVEYNNPPLAPTGLLTEGETNPSGVSTLTPKFSAIFNDDNLTDTAIKYEVQVNSQSDFQGTTLWDSTPTAMTSTNVGQRSPDITYNGTTLSFGGITYYWRIRFTDYYQRVSEWSNIAQFTTNIAPTAPTALLTDGETEAIEIEATPKFSAIFNDPDTGDTSAYYKINVNTSPDFTGTVMWDSGKISMTTINNGERCSDITYNGSSLNMILTTYYWRIKFWDGIGNEGEWSNVADFTTFNPPPQAPSSLKTEGKTLAPKVGTLTPKFTAIYSDPNPSDTGEYYEIHVNTSSDFTGTVMWSSGKTSITSIPNGHRSTDITYGGTALTFNGNTYYWRIRFWDTIDNQSDWSETTHFTMSGPPAAPSDLRVEGQTNPSYILSVKPKFSAVFSDSNDDFGAYYQIQITSVSNFSVINLWNSPKTAMSSTPSNASCPPIEYNGTALTGTSGSTYYWRIKFWDTDDFPSSWSSTGTFVDKIENTSLKMGGLKMGGINVDK